MILDLVLCVAFLALMTAPGFILLRPAAEDGAESSATSRAVAYSTSHRR